LTEEIDNDFEKIINSGTRYTTKQELRIRKLIEEKFTQLQFIQTDQPQLVACELGGDQTLPVNLSVLDAQVRQMNEQLEELQTQLQSLETQFVHIEVESLPEDVKREFTRIKNQIRELRDSGMATGYSPQYVQGMSYDSSEPFDPAKQSNSLCNFTYGAIHGDLLNELKQKQIEIGIRDQPTVVEVDAEFDKVVFDDSKCMDALMVNGKVQQCPEFKFGNTDYCKKHQKKKNKKKR